MDAHAMQAASLADERRKARRLVLQINTAGSWRTLFDFDPEARAQVLREAYRLGAYLDAGAKWAVRHPDGHREFVELPTCDATDWHGVREGALPDQLSDVMVSVHMAGDRAGSVYMAYRRGDAWILSGTGDDAISGVYAWAEIMAAAPLEVAA